MRSIWVLAGPFLLFSLFLPERVQSQGPGGSMFQDISFHGGATLNHQRFAKNFVGPYTGFGGYGVLSFAEGQGLRVQIMYGGYAANSYEVSQRNGPDLTETVKGPGWDLHIGYQHFFTGNFEDGGFYGQFAGVYKLANLKFTYDKEGVKDKQQSLGDALIEAGVGYAMEAGPGKLFFEVGGAIPARSYNSRTGLSAPVIIPPYWTPRVGYYFSP